MNKLKFLLAVFVALVMGLGVYSCGKETEKILNDKEPSEQKTKEELLSLLGYNQNNEVSIESRSVSSCKPDLTGCLVFENQRDTFLYPGTSCYVEVQYDLVRCFINGNAFIMTHSFTNFEAYPILGMGCDSILNAWNELYDSGNLEELDHQENLFLSMASSIIEYRYHNENEISWIFAILFNCNDFNTLLYSDFYVSTCTKRCNKRIIIDGIPTLDRVTVNCADVCCKRTSLWCSKDGVTMIQSNPVVERIGVCEKTEQSEDCPEGYRSATLCSDTCFPEW